MSKQRLISAHNWFYNERGFIWQSDFERLGKLEHWELLDDRNRVFVGDCEDACLTIMNRLLGQRVDARSLFIVRCASELCPSNQAFDHAILGLKVGDKWYFSDNRYPRYPAAHLHNLRSYKLYDAVSVDNLRGEGKPRLFV